MLSLKNVIEWQSGLTQLQRSNHIIKGVNYKNEVVEIDMRNCTQDIMISFMNEGNKIPKIYDVKYIQSFFGAQYYFCMDEQIISGSGNVLLESNSKAHFSSGLDGRGDYFVFSKYHKQHGKYSINVLEVGKEKKIVHLLDQKIKNAHIFMEGGDRAILFECDEYAGFINGEGFQNHEIFERANRFYSDAGKIYLLSGIEKQLNMPKVLFSPSNSPKNQFLMENKVRVEAYDKHQLVKGKGYSQFELNIHKYPIKIDTFQNDLIIGFDNCIEIFDIRKISRPILKQSLNGLRDFLYEPNLQRIYFSCQKGLHIYDYK